MRRLLLALAAAVLVTPAAHATLSVSITPGTTLTVVGGYTQTSPLAATFTITNTGSQTLELGLHRQILSEVPGSQNNFCFGVGCYPPSVSVAPQPITLSRGAQDNSFLGDYEPLGYAGITVIRYAIYEINTLDSAYVTVTYDATRAVAGLAADLTSSTLLAPLFPNPAVAGSQVSLTVAPEALQSRHQLVITDLRDGRQVARHTIGASPYHCMPELVCGTPPSIAPGGCVSFCGFGDSAQPYATTPAATSTTIQLPTAGLSAGLYSCMLIDAKGRPLAMQRLVIQ